jgi:hypothetical protein
MTTEEEPVSGIEEEDSVSAEELARELEVVELQKRALDPNDPYDGSHEDDAADGQPTETEEDE